MSRDDGPSIRAVLFGHRQSPRSRVSGVLLALGVLVSAFCAYALGLFEVSGGVILLPGDASLLGLVVAAAIGFRRGGLLFAWLSHFAAYVGFLADWAFLGLSSQSLSGTLAFLFDPVALAVLAVAAVVSGTIGFTAGSLGRRAVGHFTDDTVADTP